MGENIEADLARCDTIGQTMKQCTGNLRGKFAKQGVAQKKNTI